MNDEIITSYLLGKKSGGTTPTGEIDITQNGITNVSGYATANVQVPEKQLEEKSVTISSNTTTLIEPSTGKDGMSSVSVTTNVPEPSGKITITQNGTDIDVSSYASADVSVPGMSILPDGTKFKDSTFQTAPAVDTSRMTMMGSLFENCSNLETTPDIDFSSCTYFASTFNKCAKLTNVDYSNKQFSSSAYYFQNMFVDCTKLTNVNLPIGQLTSNAIYMHYMFSSCSKLKKVDLSNLEIVGTPATFTTQMMFQGCRVLEEIDMSKLDFTKITASDYMFGVENTQYAVPASCLILVKEQASKDWITTNFDWLTNVQIKSEYIANQGA